MIAPAALAARLLHPSVTFAALLLFMYCLRSWQQRSGRHLTAKPKAEAASRDDTLVLNCKAWRRPAGLHTAPGITPALSCRRSRDQAVSEPLSSRFLLRGGSAFRFCHSGGPVPIENEMAPEINVRLPSKALVNTLVRSSLEAGFVVNVLFDTINNRQSYLGVKSVIRMWYVLKIQCAVGSS